MARGVVVGGSMIGVSLMLAVIFNINAARHHTPTVEKAPPPPPAATHDQKHPRREGVIEQRDSGLETRD
jgi:hypothetical protein